MSFLSYENNMNYHQLYTIFCLNAQMCNCLSDYCS